MFESELLDYIIDCYKDKTIKIEEIEEIAFSDNVNINKYFEIKDSAKDIFYEFISGSEFDYVKEACEAFLKYIEFKKNKEIQDKQELEKKLYHKLIE